MKAVCPHCGAANLADESAEEVVCSQCGEVFATGGGEPRRAMWKVLAAVVVLLTGLTMLLVAPGGSGVMQTARETVFGAPVVERVGGAGWGQSDGIPDAQAGDGKPVTNAQIGRLPDRLGVRKPGEEVRPGAAGTDEPMGRVGNSRDGPEGNDNSGGGNPGNANRNSVEMPGGSDLRIGKSTGENPSGLSSTNGSTNATTRSSALLLDDFSERLKQAGARSGDVQVSLEWKNLNDLDLHVIDPAGEEIFYGHRNSGTGGLLDVDMNASQLSWRPVENVYWPEQGAPKGKYRVEVVHYANHGSPDPTTFNVRVVNKGQASYFRGVVKYVPNAVRARVTVCQFEVR